MPTRHPGRQRGYNLLELMITLTVAGVVLGIGIPSFTQFMDNSRMAAAANDLVTSIHAARTEAVKRRQAVTLCASSDWSSASPSCDLAGGRGWIVFVDNNANASLDGSDTLLLALAAPADGVQISVDAGAARYIQYGGNGFLQPAAAGTTFTNIQFCDHRGNADTGGGVAAGRWVQIGPTGRPQVYRMQAEVQGGPLGGC